MALPVCSPPGPDPPGHGSGPAQTRRTPGFLVEQTWVPHPQGRGLCNLSRTLRPQSCPNQHEEVKALRPLHSPLPAAAEAPWLVITEGHSRCAPRTPQSTRRCTAVPQGAGPLPVQFRHANVPLLSEAHRQDANGTNGIRTLLVRWWPMALMGNPKDSPDWLLPNDISSQGYPALPPHRARRPWRAARVQPHS